MAQYTEMYLHVPTKAYEKMQRAVTRASSVSIKLDLLGSPDHKLFVTTGQRKKNGRSYRET